jgi:hypothetical protein
VVTEGQIYGTVGNKKAQGTSTWRIIFSLTRRHPQAKLLWVAELGLGYSPLRNVIVVLPLYIGLDHNVDIETIIGQVAPYDEAGKAICDAEADISSAWPSSRGESSRMLHRSTLKYRRID